MSAEVEQRTRRAAASVATALPSLEVDDTAIIGIDLDELDGQLRALSASFPPAVRHSVAIKTMPHPQMLAHLSARGFGLEAASIEEVRMALRSGAAPSELIFDSPVKTRAEIAWCHDNLPGALLNANSIAELERYPREPAFQVGLRINPELSTGAPSAFDVSGDRSKFGVPIRTHRAEIIEACVAAGVTALHMHIGSQVPTADAHLEAVERLVDLAKEIDAIRTEQRDPRRMRTLDIGGGIRSEIEGTAVMRRYGERLQADHSDLFDYDVRTEFGQWVHANAGWAATRIESVEDRAVAMAFVHLGADYFMRDTYGETGADRYGFAVVRPDGRIELPGDGPVQPYDIVGPLCFAGDVLARDLALPLLTEGDWLVISDTGANTFGLWSRHCSRAVPKVIASTTDDQITWSERRTPE